MGDYKSTDDLPLEVWKTLQSYGLSACNLRVKADHPANTDRSRRKKGKAERIVLDIKESHMSAVKANDNHFMVSVSIKGLMLKYDCSRTTVNLSISIAKADLDIHKDWQFSSKRGCFVSPNDTQRKKMENMGKGRRPGRVIGHKKPRSQKEMNFVNQRNPEHVAIVPKP